MPPPLREYTTKAHYTFYPADSIGGELCYSAGLSGVSDLYSPKSGQPLPVKAYCWLNAGRLDGIDRGMSFRSSPPILQILIIAVPLKQIVPASLSIPALPLE
jgi:hypothetical protein